MITGSCLCRGIVFEVDADLGAVAICHCADCRKAQGSAYGVNAPVPRESFRLKSGEELLADYESTPGKHRVFCKRCGSPVFSRRDDDPATLRLRLGTLDGDPGTRPVLHGWISDKAPWDRIPEDGLPRFATGEPDSLVPRIRFRAENPSSPDAKKLIDALDAELAALYPPENIFGLHEEDHSGDGLVFFVARSNGDAVACGALRSLSEEVGEVKRMYVVPAWRGRGVSRRILGVIETIAMGRRHSLLRLETGAEQKAALQLYRSSGFREIPRYGEYIHSEISLCFEKKI